MSEPAVATSEKGELSQPSYAALHARGVAMKYTEFERRVLAAWREREDRHAAAAFKTARAAAKAAKPPAKDAEEDPEYGVRGGYPFNEELVGFKLLAAVQNGEDKSADLMICAALNARMGENETARFRFWGVGLRATAEEIAKLEGLV